VGGTACRRTNCGVQKLQNTTPPLLLPSRPYRGEVAKQPNADRVPRAAAPGLCRAGGAPDNTAGIPPSTTRHTAAPRTACLASWAPPRMGWLRLPLAALAMQPRPRCYVGTARHNQAPPTRWCAPPRACPFIGCFAAVPPTPCTMKRRKRPLTPTTAQPTGPSPAARRACTERAAEGAIRGCRHRQGPASLWTYTFNPPAHLTAFIRRSWSSRVSAGLSLSPLSRPSQSLTARQNFYRLLWEGGQERAEERRNTTKRVSRLV
jgi:hypothetical protein